MDEIPSTTAPVAFMIFNRPDVTQLVFEQIRHARPSQLFIIADGPRKNKEGEAELCTATRAIAENIDWPCEVLRNYSEENLGCKERIASGITWVFTHVEEAIFLEDDCLPHPDFFPFCTEMLEHYRDNTRVMHISGDNFQQRNPTYHPTDSYYFSVIPHIWGWATWRRAWSLYDKDVEKFPEVRDSKSLATVFPKLSVRLHWEHVFAQYYAKTIDSWDGQWVFCCATHNGLCVIPSVNLISNIGFRSDATHLADASFPHANLPTEALHWPLIHPPVMEENEALDQFTYTNVYGIDRYLYQKALSFLRAHFPSVYVTIRNFARALGTFGSSGL